MQKLQSWWKVLAFGVAAAAFGLMSASCAPTEDDSEEYTVTLKGDAEYSVITTFSMDPDYDPEFKTKFKEGDTVIVFAGLDEEAEFLNWTVTSGVVPLFPSIYGLDSDILVFVMPGKNVTLTANWTTDVGPATYFVDVNGGAVVGDDDEFEAGDIVTITATRTDSLFVKWVTDPSVTFTAGTTNKSSTAKFTMPADNVIVTAVYAPDVLEDLDNTAVRFTWYKVDEPNIVSIIADEASVANWKTKVFLDEEFVEEDATDTPNYPGIPGIPTEIFPTYKSQYFAVPVDNSGVGLYTAICTVYDPEFDNTAYIVANYEVTPTGDEEQNIFFEIGFDVGTFLADEGTPWIKEDRDNPQTDPRLEKRKVKKSVKTFKNGKVTYYVLHKAKK